MGNALQRDMNSHLYKQNAYLHEKSVELHEKYKKQSIAVVRNQLGKYLYGYFHQWKEMTKLYKIQLRTKMRDRVIAYHKRFLGSYFTWWKVQKDRKKQGLRGELNRKIETANDEYYKVSIL